MGLRAVTIKQVNTMGSDHSIDGAVIQQITLIGRIVHYNPAPTPGGWIMFRISDNTGSIMCRMWPNGQDTTLDNALEKPIGTVYVKFYGTITSVLGTPVITGSLRPMPDSNEMTFHFLNAIHTHLRLTKGPMPST